MKPEDFVRQNSALTAPPLVPELRLHLATEVVPLWRKTEEELSQMGVPPPYWAFAWAGGQALARYVLDNPGLVASKRVLDFGAGSGLVALAAARAGAAYVLAADIDKFAVAAINAKSKNYDVRLGGVIANRSKNTDEIDRFNAAIGLERVAHFPDLDVIRRSRLKKSTLFEMEPSPELEAVQQEYLRLAASLWVGSTTYDCTPMKDRDVFEFLGFE